MIYFVKNPKEGTAISPISLLLVTHDRLLEQRPASRLETQPDFVLSGVVATLKQACEEAHCYDAKIVMVDLAAPGAADASQWCALRFCYPAAWLIARFDKRDDKAMKLAFLAGARSFLSKAVGEDMLRRRLKEVLLATPILSDNHLFDSLLVPGYEARPEPNDINTIAPTPEHLTPREWDTLVLLVEGLSNKEIASRLCLSEKRVKNCVSNILSKLGVGNRTQAALWAKEQGVCSRQHEAS